DVVADASLVVLGLVQARSGERLDRRGDAVMDERVHLLHVFRRHPRGRIEIAYLARDAGRERARVEMGDRTDAAVAGTDVRPRRVHVVADGTDQAEAGDDHATLAHDSTFRYPQTQTAPISVPWSRACDQGTPLAQPCEAGRLAQPGNDSGQALTCA